MGCLALASFRWELEQRVLDDSIAHFQQARDLCPPSHPSSATVLFHLANAKVMGCRTNDVCANLDAPIELYQTSLSLRSRDHPEYPHILLSLGVCLKARFQRQADEADKGDADTLLSQVLDVCQPDSYVYQAAIFALHSAANTELLPWGVSPHSFEHSEEEKLEKLEGIDRLDVILQRIFHLDSSVPLFDPLGILFCVQWNWVDSLIGLEEAISLQEVVAQYTPDDHPYKLLRLAKLAHSLWHRHEHRKDIVDSERSISLMENALRLTPDGHPEKPTILDYLSMSMSTRYEQFDNIEDLEKLISLKEDGLRLTPDGPDKRTRLDDLARLLSRRYERLDNIVDLEKLIPMVEDIVRFRTDGDPGKAKRLGYLGKLLSSRYERFCNVVDLEKSISSSENALELTPDSDPDKPRQLHILTRSLRLRFQRFGDIVDLEKSISLSENALQLTPDGDPNKPRRLHDLASSLWLRFQRFGDVMDLEKSVSLEEDALRLMPNGSPEKLTVLTGLATLLLGRHERFGDIADLEKSMTLGEDVMQLTPDDHPDKPLRLHNLASSLLQRYECLGDIVDLDKAISLEEDALRFTPDSHPDALTRLERLAYSLLIRYERFGDIADLEKSISLREDGVQRMPDDHPDKTTMLSNLAYSISCRYNRNTVTADLEKPLSLYEDILRLTPADHPDMPLRLYQLAFSLWKRYRHSEDIVDLEKSISLTEDALKLTPSTGGRPGKPQILGHLAYSLSSRHERFGDTVDLERSISLAEDAVRLTPDDHPSMAIRMNETARLIILGSANSLKFKDHCDTLSIVRRAILYSSRAAHSYTSQPSVRFESSAIWASCLWFGLEIFPKEIDSESLIDAYTVAVDLLPQLAWIGLSFQDRYHQLLKAAGIVSDAAAAALDLRRPALAVEWLEQGRSIMWKQVSQLRTPIDDLRSSHPAIAARFEHVSHKLERAGVRHKDEIHNHPNMTDGTLEQQADDHHKRAILRETVLTEIRALPGFEAFLLPKKIDQLSYLVHPGHVVLLNASEHRCDALVIMETSKQVTHIPLSLITHGELASMRAQLSTVLRNNGRVILRGETDRAARLVTVRLGADDVFRSILSSLWSKVVNPILDALGLSSALNSQLSRILWCPNGPFTFLPIHAAGIYDTDNRGPKLSDFVVSSYIPTMSALEKPPQQDSLSTSSKLRFLAVPQPSTDGECHLYGVKEEMQFMRELTSSSPFMELQEADGTVEDVLAKMKESDWVHFCCHGMQDHVNPLDSGLLLADCTRLKLSDVVQLSRPRRGLAFLSACQTAMGDEKLSDEAIHLAAGMLLAGYSGVIATMWSIMDRDAPRVTKDVYTSLFGDSRVPDGSRAAEALHHAVEKLRDSGAPFLSWVPFVHYGL
ncbi:hypothetical protein JVU11DRAFT_12972 [Chiua virens]|nr:hypothetical protein JVU11DRAFT_12972 [Chiua virens]